MAESSLSIGASNLRAEIGFFLGYGRTSGNWSAAQLSEINTIMQSGVRRVYYPPAMDADSLGYEWSWLRPTATLTLESDYDTGTITVVSGVVTLANGTWPSWAAAGVLIIDSTEYAVSTRDSGSQITLVDTSVNEAAGTEYTLHHEPDYDLPDDFGRLINTINFEPDEYQSPISIISVGKLLAMRAYGTTDGAPKYAAIRYKSSTGASGQRQEILFFPDPDDAYVLYYEYEAYAGELSDSYPYPLGGMQMAEVYIESVLAVAESRINDEIGQHVAQFKALLQDAIARDRKRGARSYGQMGHVESVNQEFRRGWTGGTYPVSYKGESI